MPILTIVLVLIIVGVLLWLVNAFVPMDAKIKTVINILVMVVVIIWLLKILGAFTFLNKVNI